MRPLFFSFFSNESKETSGSWCLSAKTDKSSKSSRRLSYTSKFKSTMLLCPLESTTNCGVKFAYFFKRDFLFIIAPFYFTIRLPLCHHEALLLINQFVLGMMNEESHIFSLKNGAES